MSRPQHVSALMTIERNEQEIEVAISGTYVPGEREVRYLRNGDPGHPGSPDEIQDITVTLKDGDDAPLTDAEFFQAHELLLEDAHEQHLNHLEGPDDE